MTFDLDAAIYARYIVPTRRRRSHRIGLEFELPVVNLDAAPADFSLVHRMTEAFVSHFAFRRVYRDEDGFIYSAADERTGDDISFDCSYNTLEFSMGAERDLNVIYDRFVSYYTFVQKQLAAGHHTLTGMGINPRCDLNLKEPVANGRYRMLLHHLQSYTRYGNLIPFHDRPDYGLFCCSSQVQLDVQYEDLVEVLNTFSRLEPLKALIFANSIWGEEQELLLARDQFWRNSLHGLNRHNADMYGLEFGSVDEIVRYIRSMSLYCTERDGRYLNFRPTPLQEYFQADSIEAEYYDGRQYRTIFIRPEKEDLQYLRSYKLEDLTFRGTVELRSVCEQPVREIMTPAAYHVGLMKNLHGLTEMLEEDRVIYHQGYNAAELRRMFSARILPDAFDWKAVADLEERVLALAEDGLRQRGYGEERFLLPLWRRARELVSPAREMAEGRRAGRSLIWYIEDYAQLPGPDSVPAAAAQRVLPPERTFALHLSDEQVRLHFLEGNIGLERESLRVTPEGTMSQTPDPFPGDPHIVRDFCENQVEINTGVHPGVAGAMRELKHHHDRIIDALQSRPEKEYLWPCSNPPYIHREEDIPIAVYEGDQAHKTEYRRYLSDKYGRYKMTFSGIHVNYSFSEGLLRADRMASGLEKTEGGTSEAVVRRHRSRLYLDLAQGLVSYGWLLTALTAASPVLDSSYVEKGLCGRDVFTGMASVRCSELGYWNDFASVFDYSDVDAYADSVQHYMKRGFLKAPSELYYPIRLKPPGDNSLERLRRYGVDHIELRMFDLNPLQETGLDGRDVIFAQLFIIWLACTQRETLSDREQVQAVQNFKNAAHYDLKTVKIVRPSGESVPAADEGARVLLAMRDFFRALPEGKIPDGTDGPAFPGDDTGTTTIERIEEVLWFEYQKMERPQLRYAWQLRNGWTDGFASHALALAKQRQDRIGKERKGKERKPEGTDLCELFGVSSPERIRLNRLLREFFSHGNDHPHGWGMAFFYGNAVSLEKQPQNSTKSDYLMQRLRSEVLADQMIAHIRLATKGAMDYENTHPFVMRDSRNRSWTLAHNGTIFDCDALSPYVHRQAGRTDSERILYYLIDRINEAQDEKGAALTGEERFRVVDEVIHVIAPENKVNLLLYDGSLLYAHTNYRDSLHCCRKGKAMIISTRPLDDDVWEDVPMNTLVAYRNGVQRYTGRTHEYEFFDTEEKMRYLFLDFAAL